MDAPSTDRANLIYSDLPPILVAAASDATYARAARAIAAAGLRASDRIALNEARDRVDRQAVASAIWVELDSADGDAVDELLDRLIADVAQGCYGAVISASSGAIDAIAARIVEPDVE